MCFFAMAWKNKRHIKGPRIKKDPKSKGKDAPEPVSLERPKRQVDEDAVMDGSFVPHRALKHHEKKLLKHHGNFVTWKFAKENHTEALVVRKYILEDREDYKRYLKFVFMIRKLMKTLAFLPADSTVRLQITKEMLEKLHDIGIIRTTENLAILETVTVSRFCERRLASRVVRMKMAPNMTAAVKFIKHGHIRVGPDRITDPGYLVPRRMDDHVTWVLNSKIRQQIMNYGQQLDDYDLHN